MNIENKKIVNRVTKALGITKSDLAKKFGVSKGAIHSWCMHGIPSEYCAEIEALLRETNDPLTRVNLRPNDYKKWWPELANNSDEKAA